MKENMKKETQQEPTRHKIEIEQKNGLFFVSIDGQQLTKTRKARAHRAEITRPETFLTADTAYKAGEKELARQRKLAVAAASPAAIAKAESQNAWAGVLPLDADDQNKLARALAKAEGEFKMTGE